MIGDVNDDGFADLGIGAQSADLAADFLGAAYVFTQVTASTTVDAAPIRRGGDGYGDQVGSGFSDRCDLDGDGIDDLVYGARPSGGPHRVFVVYGPIAPSAGSALTTADAIYEHSFVEIGRTIACGDIDGDGADDIVMGGRGEGHMWLEHGGLRARRMTDRGTARRALDSTEGV